LALLEAEPVDPDGRSPGEIADSVLQAVVDGELLALGDQLVALASERAVSPVDVVGALLNFVECEEPRLVEIGEAAPFGVVGFDLAFEFCQFCCQYLVVGGWRGRSEGGLPSGQDFGVEQRGSDLFEDEGVQDVGPDAAFGA
jgi:hypothetical protein